MTSVTTQDAFDNTLHQWGDLVILVGTGWWEVEDIQSGQEGTFLICYRSGGRSHQTVVQPDFLLQIDDEQDEIYE